MDFREHGRVVLASITFGRSLSLNAGRVGSLQFIAPFLVAALALIGPPATAQTPGEGTVDSERIAGPRYMRLDFDSQAAAEHEVTVTWDSDADVRFRVRNQDGTSLSSTVRGPSPGTWTGMLEASTGYYVIVWSTDGIATYTAAIETAVDSPPAISSQPSALTVTEGDDASFAVLASGEGALSYQWFADGVAIPNAIDSTLRLGAVALADDGTGYSVGISDANGSTTMSDSAVLSVEEGSLPAATVEIGQGTLDAEKDAGPRWVRLGFNSLAVAEHVLTVEWDGDADVRFFVNELDGTNLSGTVRGANPGTWTGVLEADTAHSIGLWSRDGVADYDVTIAAVETNVAFAITSQPADIGVVVGDDATFAVESSGAGSISHQWFVDGSPIAGGNESSLAVSAASIDDDGRQYAVEVSNGTETLFSDVATLSVSMQVPPRRYSQKADENTWMLVGPAPTLDYNVSEASSSWGRVLLRMDDVLLVGGDFSGIRPSRGRPVTDRPWLAAFDAITGQPVSTFQVPPEVDGVVRALTLSPDGDKVYAGGDFGLLVLDPRTGALESATDIRKWRKRGRVFDIAATDTHVYIGGDFFRVEGVSQKHIARLFHDGTMDTSWKPDLRGGFSNGREAPVQSVTLSTAGDAVYLGGNFTSINGVDIPLTNLGTLVSMLAVDAGEGASVRPERFTPVVDKDKRVKVRDIAVTEDHVIIAWGGPNHLTFHSHDGARLYQYDGTGDTQALKVIGDILYVGHHGEFFGSLTDPMPPRAVTSLDPEIVVPFKFHSFLIDGSSFPLQQAWRIDGFFGVWGISVADDSVWVSGQMSLAGSNGRSVNGLARFPAARLQ